MHLQLKPLSDKVRETFCLLHVVELERQLHYGELGPSPEEQLSANLKTPPKPMLLVTCVFAKTNGKLELNVVFQL